MLCLVLGAHQGGARMRKVLGVGLVAVAVVVATAVPSFALTADADGGTDMVSGNVYALDAGGGFIYIGGKFHSIRDPDKRTTCTADNLVRFDETTGAGDCSWTPTLPGTYVHGLAVLGGFVYVGGDFGLVRVDTTTGLVDPTFSIDVGRVNAVTAAADGSGVYFGGAFHRVNGHPHADLAFVSTAGAVSKTFAPSLDGTVRHIRISPDGYLVVSGGFEHASGHLDQSIAELDPSTGAVNTGFAAAIPEIGAMTCFDTAPTSTVIYAACGNKHNFMAAFDASSGAQIWRQGLGGNGESIALTGSTLFVGGHFGTRDPTTEQCGSNYLHGVLTASTVDGTIDCDWDPLLVPDTHNYTGGWVMDLVGSHLWVGGRFSSIDGIAHHGVARWTL